jgi:NAD(P)H-hydrate epimerase
MEQVTIQDVQKLRRIEEGSHKGQNGRLLLIGGSALFHAASLWSLTVASRIVDLVHYCSVEENNNIVAHAKEEFRNGIVISRTDVRSYIEEDDVILIGPGMTRDDETRDLTHSLLTQYPNKQWVIDAGALQMVDTNLIPHGAILTPHHGEFESLRLRFTMQNPEFQSRSHEEDVCAMATALHCTLLVKGAIDIACNEEGNCQSITGGNAGMTKGGTGDVLAGLIAALACTNSPYLATIAGSYINKAAGDELYTTVGPYFNASDLADQIPKTMKKLLY